MFKNTITLLYFVIFDVSASERQLRLYKLFFYYKRFLLKSLVNIKAINE